MYKQEALLHIDEKINWLKLNPASSQDYFSVVPAPRSGYRPQRNGKSPMNMVQIIPPDLSLYYFVDASSYSVRTIPAEDKVDFLVGIREMIESLKENAYDPLKESAILAILGHLEDRYNFLSLLQKKNLMLTIGLMNYQLDNATDILCFQSSPRHTFLLTSGKKYEDSMLSRFLYQMGIILQYALMDQPTAIVKAPEEFISICTGLGMNRDFLINNDVKQVEAFADLFQDHVMEPGRWRNGKIMSYGLDERLKDYTPAFFGNYLTYLIKGALK